MLILLLNLSGAAVLIWVLTASIRAWQAPQHHDISASEIHPDLGAGEELLEDVLAENHRADRTRSDERVRS
jgi:hypothetical protein